MNVTGKWWLVVLAALVAALALSGSTLAASLGQIAEFSTPTANAAPEGMVAGPDGNLWFAEFLQNRIAEVNPSTDAISEFTVPTTSSGPTGVARGPDGDIWFTEFGGNKIGEINPTTHAFSEFAIPTASSNPVAIVDGPNGNMWFTEAASPGKIGEINPTTHAVTEFPAATSGVQPFGIAVGPDGNVWYTEKDTGGTNSRIGVMNPSTGATTDFAITASSEPNSLATGPNGSLWVTESAGPVSKIGLVNTTTDTVTPFSLTTGTQPTVIVPGPDGEMWFTASGNPGQIGEINPVTHDVTEFPTPTATGGPVGIATGADGNVWFTETGASKVGVVGAGVAGPVATAASVAGAPQVGQTLTCANAVWSTWAGQQPTVNGFRWLLDGGVISGAAAQTLSVPAADAGHKLSCEEIATYPLVATTVSSTSAAVTVSPAYSAALTSTATKSPTSVALTISCQGLPSQRCAGSANLTSHVTTQGKTVVAVAATTKKKKKKKKTKPKPPKRVTKVENVGSAAYSIPSGPSSRVTVSLNGSGKGLLAARYKLPATLTVTGTASAKKTVTFKYGVISLSPSFTWHFSNSGAFASELGVSHLPKGSKVTLSCHGKGCPIARKTFARPKSGKLELAPTLKKHQLGVHSTVQIQITAPNEVGEVVVFTVVAGKSPTEAFRCLPPGAHVPTACAR